MMKQKIAALINVKTIVTFVVAAVFAVLAFRESIGSSEALIVITTVFGFYFGTQKQKVEENAKQ